MRKCIYCRKQLEDNNFTLEHIIPKFLGGAYAPDEYKTNDVCGKCNNNLGLFVDAAFEKNFLVYNELIESANALFDFNNPTGLPLKCLGITDLNLPEMLEDELCEFWLGPFGEQVYWVRPKDDRLNSYTGGNPRTVKKNNTRAYFTFSERSCIKPELTWLTFRDAFLGRKVKKIMCTTVSGHNPLDIGFSAPDNIDELRISYIKEKCSNCQPRYNEIIYFEDYDKRFMAKIAIGMLHVLFGDEILKSTYAEELYKTLWYKEENDEPKVNGVGDLVKQNELILNQLGIDYGVTITIKADSDNIVVNLNLNKKKNWMFVCAKSKDLANEQIQKIGDGICIVLFKFLKKGMKINLPDLLSHKLGNVLISDLEEIEKVANSNVGALNKILQSEA